MVFNATFNTIAVIYCYLPYYLIGNTILSVIYGGSVMVLNATFNNISVISWQSVLLVEETGENHRPVASTPECVINTN
jgi:hypothetical protein